MIDKAEAERRFAAEIAAAREVVGRFSPNLDEGTAAALTSLTFNTGSGWTRSGLGAAIQSGDVSGAKEIFERYVHAGGQKLPGLVARRSAEVQWIGMNEQSTPSHLNDREPIAISPAVHRVTTGESAGIEPEPTVTSAALQGAGIAKRTLQGVDGGGGLGSQSLAEALARVILMESLAGSIVRATRRNEEA